MRSILGIATRTFIIRIPQKSKPSLTNGCVLKKNVGRIFLTVLKGEKDCMNRLWLVGKREKDSLIITPLLNQERLFQFPFKTRKPNCGDIRLTILK